VPMMTDLRFYFELLFTSPRQRVLAEVRARWGQRGTKDAWLASRYFDLTGARSATSRIEDKTWSDLEFPKIFLDLDTAITPVGSQVLFEKLRVCTGTPDELAEQYGIYETLRTNAPLREEIQLKLAFLRDDSNATIADYVFGKPPEKPRYYFLIPLLSIFSAIVLIAVLVQALALWFWLAIVAGNMVIIRLVSPQFYRDAEDLKACARMLRVADGLASIRTDLQPIPTLTRLAEGAPQRANVRNAIRWFAIPQDSELLASLFMWLKLAFLVELLTYIHAIDRFVRFRSVLASTYELIGSVDAAIAIASFLERCPKHCQPIVSDRSLIDIENGWHPLLDQPIDNSIRLDGKSALITGSNMAGKTTFIKMVGVNIIFGQTLGFCLASNAIVPRSSVSAAIRGEHSVESGKSHYFAEVEAILSFIQSAQRGGCRIFLIDELFSGTNTAERIAAAQAVLRSISSSAQVLVTTHDIELQELLGERFDLYHFQEDPDIEGFFDYRLRPGRARERNAIRLLERLGFPEEVVQDAMAFVTKNAEHK
jgi:hypothetical protein